MNKLNPSAAAILFLSVFLVSPGPGAEDIDAEKALQKTPKSFSLTGTLEESIRYLEKLSGVNIRVDWGPIEGTGVKRKTKVLLAGGDTKLIEIIELMLVQVMEKGKPLGWFIQGNTLHLTTQARVLRRNVAPARSGRKYKKPSKTRSSVRSVRELKFDRAELADVIETLRGMSGVNIFVNWRALETEGLNRETPITFRAKNISTAQALNLVMRGLNGDKDKLSSIYWVVDGGVVHISTGAGLNTIMRTRVEDVADLLAVTPNFVGRRIQLSAIGDQRGNSEGGSGSDSGDMFEDEDEDNRSGTSGEQSLPELRARQKEQLIDIVKNSIGRDMWEPAGKGSITLFNKKLVITQSLLGWKLMEMSGR
ncbi:MAG TPA: hypothetical protein ENH84_05565 [Phycisphaerae bacterium]|nr:hypothetical protein [Phycisphaerae bacterium]